MSMSNFHSQSEGMSYRNVVDDYSTELAHLHMATHSSEDVAQVSISKNDNLATHEQYEYSYQDEDSEHSEEYSEDEEENTSRLDYQFEQKHAHHSNSEAEYSEDLIKEISEEDLYQEDSNQHSKNYFEKTLTNMRIAFGSEQRVRENSVKTLEKMEFSVEGSNSGKKTEEKSSIFEKKSFQDFSLKKFTELMQVKNMKNFQSSMQKTFREYNKTKILSASDKKNGNNRTSSTPKKSKCISPRKFSMKDLELDRIGYEKMKENSEKKNKFISQIIGSSSSQNRRNNSSILYKSNLSIDKCRKEINMNDFSEEAANSVTHLGYKGLSPCKNNFSYEKERQQYKDLLEPINQPQFDSPEPSKSMDSNPSSRKKISKTEREVIEELSVNETPYEDENVETVKLDSSRLRSQKRGLPMEERSCEKEETPKCTTTQRRIYRAEENCYTGEKYVLGDCFTDEKLHEMRLRNAVTSAKKINPLQIMKDLKSPATSSYISSAKKALIEEEGEFDEDDKIEFQLSAAREYNPREITGKENVRSNNNNILVERFSSVDEKDNALKNFVNANKFDFLEPDYNLLESPEKSNHKHSKSRSRTKEKRNNRSEGEPENLEVCKAESFERLGDNTCMMIDFNNSPDEHDRNNKDLEETSKSLEWILAKNIDKKKRDEICRIIGEEESRNTMHEDHLDSYSIDRNMQHIEVEEVKRVRFGNSMIRNENIGFDYREDNGDSNLGQYIECLESVESSATKSVKAVAEKDILRDKETTAEYMTDEILSMMLYNDIHD